MSAGRSAKEEDKKDFGSRRTFFFPRAMSKVVGMDWKVKELEMTFNRRREEIDPTAEVARSFSGCAS
jgi:hypothetical protein